jgi:hypothetical protein
MFSLSDINSGNVTHVHMYGVGNSSSTNLHIRIVFVITSRR